MDLIGIEVWLGTLQQARRLFCIEVGLDEAL